MDINVKKAKPKHIIEQQKWREQQLKLFLFFWKTYYKYILLKKEHMYYMNKKGYVKGFYK